MGKQAGTYGAEDQSILPVPIPICSHLTRNPRGQPVTPAPVTLTARDSLLACPGPPSAHIGHTGSPPQGELGGSGEASWGKVVYCHGPAASGRNFLSPPSKSISLLTSPRAHFLRCSGFSKTRGGQNHTLRWVPTLRNTASPSTPAPPKMRAQPRCSQEEPAAARAAPLSIIHGAAGEIPVCLVTAENLAAIFRQPLPWPG